MPYARPMLGKRVQRLLVRRALEALERGLLQLRDAEGKEPAATAGPLIRLALELGGIISPPRTVARKGSEANEYQRMMLSLARKAAGLQRKSGGVQQLAPKEPFSCESPVDGEKAVPGMGQGGGGDGPSRALSHPNSSASLRPCVDPLEGVKGE